MMFAAIRLVMKSATTTTNWTEYFLTLDTCKCDRP